LQRGYDQLIHDVCLQGLPVLFAIDRAGLVGEDSPTQNGVYDLTFLRAVPGLRIGAPRDGTDLERMLAFAMTQDGPTALRYARSEAPMIGPETGRAPIICAETLKEGTDAVFLTVGPCAGEALTAAAQLARLGRQVGVIDARWVKPLDYAMLNRIAGTPIITVEENTLDGGFGSAVLEYYERQGLLPSVRIRRLGVPDRYIQHATRREQLVECGLDADSLYRTMLNWLEANCPAETANGGTITG